MKAPNTYNSFLVYFLSFISQLCVLISFFVAQTPMCIWFAKAMKATTDLNKLVPYIIARAHVDGYSLIKWGTVNDEEGIKTTYLSCSRQGFKATGRASIKCDCKFQLRLNRKLTGEISMTKNLIKHNHAPHLVVQNSEGKYILEIQQKFLWKEDEEHVANGLLKDSKTTSWARHYIIKMLVERYLDLFATFNDTKAEAAFRQVCITYSINLICGGKYNIFLTCKYQDRFNYLF